MLISDDCCRRGAARQARFNRPPYGLAVAQYGQAAPLSEARARHIEEGTHTRLISYAQR